jgi:hypothetical protein
MPNERPDKKDRPRIERIGPPRQTYQRCFVVVPEGFNNFGNAIWRNLIFEIAGRMPDNIHRVQGYEPPPCDIGKRMI